MSPEGREQDVDWRPPTVPLADVSGDYFATARVPVIEGRSVAYYVGQRTREFGIRMALGARRSDIIGDVLARGGRFALLGVVGGGALAAALAHMLRTLLVGVSPFDPVTTHRLQVSSPRSYQHGARRSAIH